MERETWKENQSNDNSNIVFAFDCDRETVARSRERSSALPSSPPKLLGYIEHPVSKFDTLAGIAIKYGVEVADIKKLNGLVTDHQMFALKTIHIPLPGRHPPSPCLSNGSSTPGHGSFDESPDRAQHELFESFQSLRVKSSERKVSPAMSSLQGYYGLKGAPENDIPNSVRLLSHHRKSKSLVNVILNEIMEKYDNRLAEGAREADSDKQNDKLIRRRQKSEADFSKIPELLMKEDFSGSAGVPPRTGKGLALRQKAAIRTALTNDPEPSGLNPLALSTGDASLTEGPSTVRKSSSTSCLQVLPKPGGGRRNKAALD